MFCWVRVFSLPYLYKCVAVGDEGELSGQGVEISVIVINYGGMPATGSIKLISLWNKTPVVIAECNRIEGFGNWNVKTHIDFAPASVFLEYEGKVVNSKTVYYPHAEECIILYPTLLIVLSTVFICGKKKCRR